MVLLELTLAVECLMYALSLGASTGWGYLDEGDVQYLMVRKDELVYFKEEYDECYWYYEGN